MRAVRQVLTGEPAVCGGPLRLGGAALIAVGGAGAVAALAVTSHRPLLSVLLVLAVSTASSACFLWVSGRRARG